MFSTISSKIILQNNSYLSFPDIIHNPYKPRQYFIIFREGNSHHPTWSNLILMCSEDSGKKWTIIKKFSMDLEKNGFVWNCPRFYYNTIEQSLNIICDIKNTTTESTAHFKILNLKSYDEGRSFTRTLTEMPGMVPDKVLAFKGRLYCANHKIKPDGHKVAQLVSWSRTMGEHGSIRI